MSGKTKDAIGRRKRFSPTPTGKYVKLNATAIEIFKLLIRYPYLSSRALYALVPSEHRLSYQRFQSLLTTLYHENNTAHGDRYLNRPDEQKKNMYANHHDLVYSLLPPGRLALKDHELEYKNSPLIDSGQLASFPHGMMLCEVMSSIEIGIQQDRKAAIVTQQEILEHANRTSIGIKVSVAHKFSAQGIRQTNTFTLYPDALFGINYSGKFLFFALEVENKGRCNTKDLRYSSYLRKMLGYQFIFEKKRYQEYYRIPNLLVLSVGPQIHRVEAMMQTAMSICNKTDHLLFSHQPVFGSREQVPRPSDRFYASPWLRIKNKPFTLAKP